MKKIAEKNSGAVRSAQKNTQKFILRAPYEPAGDQPAAIDALADGLARGDKAQTLLGVTGSGKTFAVACVIEKIQRPTLVIAHNKTLAAQLCNEFREFFPAAAVEYFVSYYDYYQPEAYLAASDTYIEKEAMVNDEIDRLRHAATQALLTRRDVIIVSSVSCIYGLGAPENYAAGVLQLHVGEPFDRAALLKKLIALQFTRTATELKRGTFRLRGEVLDIVPAEDARIYRVDGTGGRVRGIEIFDAVTRAALGTAPDAWIFPTKHFVSDAAGRTRALKTIEAELNARLKFFESRQMLVEADRLRRRTRYDLNMLREIGYVNGVENYSRHFDGRAAGDPPHTLLDYFPHHADGTPDFLTVIDESHVTVPQIGGMSGGDAARKRALVDHGFRLPSAADNRPLTFAEFDARVGARIFVSATPAEYERTHSAQIVEQIIRPTGLVDPEIIVRPVTASPVGKNKNRAAYAGQVQDLIARIIDRVARHERVMVTTLTKKMAEDLTDFLKQKKIQVTYLHSDIDTISRIQIMQDFRRGVHDVLVGVNLLREGLDIPEVSLVAIMDADKEGFLRSETSLIQTIGRAARNAAGQVVLYADEMTGSLDRAINETERRRTKQLAYNAAHHIIPQTIIKEVRDILKDFGLSSEKTKHKKQRTRGAHQKNNVDAAALDLSIEDGRPLDARIKEKEMQMRSAATALEFELAALLRDEIITLHKKRVRENRAERHVADPSLKTKRPRATLHS